jgi:hypothetical protein
VAAHSAITNLAAWSVSWNMAAGVTHVKNTTVILVRELQMRAKCVRGIFATNIRVPSLLARTDQKSVSIVNRGGRKKSRHGRFAVTVVNAQGQCMWGMWSSNLREMPEF